MKWGLFKRIDRYIIKKFLVAYFFVTALFILIAIVIDISEKLEDFLNCDASLREIIVEYYLSFVPYIGALLTPIFIFIAVIFFTSKMAYNSEIISILSSGTSYLRFLRPYVIAGSLLCGLLLYANHWLVPRANKVRIAFEREHIKGSPRYGRNIHIRVDPQTFISLENYRYHRDEGTSFAIEKFDAPKPPKELAYKLTASRIQWLPEDSVWRIRDYQVWQINGLEESYTMGSQLDTVLPITPQNMEVDVYIKESLDYAELERFIDEESRKGSKNLEFYRVEQHRRTSSALSIIILTLIGAAIASRKVRGGTGFHIALGFGLSALYIVFLQFSATFSTNAGLHPLIGTNIPNLIFGLLSVYLIRQTPK